MGFLDEIKNRKNPIIPEGGLYVTANGKEFKAGEHFPSPQTGDTYKIGTYTYDICAYGETTHLYAKISLNLQVTDRSRKTYDPILPEINGVQLKNADGLFKDCSKMEKAPDIPEGASYTEIFSGCYNLRKMPVFGHHRGNEAFRPLVSDATQPQGAVLPHTIRHWSMDNDIIRAFGEKQVEPRPKMRPRHRAAYERKQREAEVSYYGSHPDEINPKNQLYKLAKYPLLFETFGEKQLGPYRGEPYLSATTGTIIMNAEDIANSKMIDFDNFDKEEVQGSIVKSERFFNTTLKPEIKSAGQDDQNINNDEEEIDL